MIIGFAKFLDSCNVFMPELWGLYEGINLIRGRGMLKVEINVNSTKVLKGY